MWKNTYSIVAEIMHLAYEMCILAFDDGEVALCFFKIGLEIVHFCGSC